MDEYEDWLLAGIILIILIIIAIAISFYIICYQNQNQWMEIDKLEYKPSLKIFLLAYNDKTLNKSFEMKSKYPYFEPHILKQSVYLENELLFWIMKPENLHQIDHVEWIGTLASSFQNKIPFYDFQKLTAKYNNKDIIFLGDHLGFTKFALRATSHYLDLRTESLVTGHPHLFEILSLTVQMLGWPNSLLHEPIQLFYFNYWILKRKWFLQWLQVLEKVRNYWESDKIINDLLWQDANYDEKKLSNERKKEIFGVPYFTHHCFVLERLICVWANYMRIKTNFEIGCIGLFDFVPTHQ